MTARAWHHWHLAHPRTPRAPHLRLSAGRAAALRAGLVVALCALLAGSCGAHLRAGLRGPLAPTRTLEPTRA